MFSRYSNFIKTDIWRIRLNSVSERKSFFIRQLRIIVLAIKGFDEDKCSLKASALTFYTLLSVVPVIAMIFGIAKGFGFEKTLEQQLLQRLQGQQEVMRQVISFAHTLLENTRGGLIAGIGIALLFWTVIKLLSNIENSFNDIWGVQTSRSLGRKFSDYLSVMLICPVLFMCAGSLTIAITSQIKTVVRQLPLLQAVGPAIMSLLSMLPYCFVWVLFSFLYLFMPNTKVHVRSGILAGIVAGTVYQIMQWAYISFQIGVAKYNAIYGGFAALPLFLVWLEMSWLIVLLGAEISFAHQNVHTYELEPDCHKASYAFRRLVSLRVVQLIVKNFQKGGEPFTVYDMSSVLDLPVRLINQILDALVQSGIIHEVRQKSERVIGYQPARSIETLTIKYVLDALEHSGSDAIPLANSPELDELSRHMQSLNALMDGSPDNVLLKDIKP